MVGLAFKRVPLVSPTAIRRKSVLQLKAPISEMFVSKNSGFSRWWSSFTASLILWTRDSLVERLAVMPPFTASCLNYISQYLNMNLKTLQIANSYESYCEIIIDFLIQFKFRRKFSFFYCFLRRKGIIVSNYSILRESDFAGRCLLLQDSWTWGLRSPNRLLRGRSEWQAGDLTIVSDDCIQWANRWFKTDSEGFRGVPSSFEKRAILLERRRQKAPAMSIAHTRPLLAYRPFFWI